MSQDQDKVDKARDTIRKLLNVAKNDAATEGEINNALNSARALMKRYHLNEEDVSENEDDLKRKIRNAEKGQVFVSIKSKLYGWEGDLAYFCAQFVGGVGAYASHNKKPARDHRGFVMFDEWGEPYEGKQICFYGICEDSAMAAELFHELRLLIMSMARLKFGSCYKGHGGKYSEGFVSGLKERIKQQALLEQRTATPTGLIFIGKRDALIEYKAEEAKKFIEQKFPRMGKWAGAYGATGSHEAFVEGKNDGRKADVEAAKRPKITG